MVTTLTMLTTVIKPRADKIESQRAHVVRVSATHTTRPTLMASLNEPLCALKTSYGGAQTYRHAVSIY